MRKMMGAAIIGLTVAGGAVIAGTANAQPYGYYYAPAPGYYDNGYYRSGPPPYYSNGYNGYYTAPGLGGALLGSALPGAAYPAGVPVDRYGPDPNGMIAPDGHKIKCKLRSGYDERYGRYRTFRMCW
jgi:hypothetical protein